MTTKSSEVSGAIGDPHWVYDRLPPSGARRGGDPAEHAFKHDLDTFVREVVQNANDQRLGSAAVEVHFRVHELSDEKGTLAPFLDKLSWQRTLEPHLRAAGSTKGGRAVGRFLRELDRSERLVLLTIEDRHTVGLTGDESDEESHFRALCKDTLYSHKRTASAGGSYGLGKSVLWAFSGISTVLFNSVLERDPASRRSPRLIGRVELPSHKIGARWFSGSGWFGRPTTAEGGARAESLWSLEAAIEARDLFLARAERATGTSILIVGFHDPTLDEEPTAWLLAGRIRTAAIRYFWPGMEMGTPGLRVSADGAVAAPSSDEAIAPFVECWRARASRRAALEQAGDVVTRAIPIELPPAREAAHAVKGEVLLIVRVAPDGTRHALGGHVAMFRGPGMVVKYWDRSGLAQGMRPFHAILACGMARDPERPTDSDREIERFLRDAEPPGHDDWHSTPALKEGWKRGYAKALEQLKDRVGHALRDLLAPRPSHGSRGPERLEKRFPIGERGTSEPEPSVFRFTDLTAEFDGVRWTFAGTVRPAQALDVPWRAQISMREVGDREVPLDPIAIEWIAVDTSGARATVEDGVAIVDTRTGVERVDFRGASGAVVGDPGEIMLEIGGRMSLEAE